MPKHLAVNKNSYVIQKRQIFSRRQPQTYFTLVILF